LQTGPKQTPLHLLSFATSPSVAQRRLSALNHPFDPTLSLLHPITMGGSGGGAGSDEFFVPHTGSEGWRGLLENKRALGLATFASLGGVLYGYNQGVFGQVQVMHNFTKNYNDTVSRCFSLALLVYRLCSLCLTRPLPFSLRSAILSSRACSPVFSNSERKSCPRVRAVQQGPNCSDPRCLRPF
jgi:hypothetical protein